MPKRKNEISPSTLGNGPLLALFFLFPFFLVFFIGWSGDSLPAVLSASSPRWLAQALDIILLLVLVNMALAVRIASQKTAPFKWFSLFILLASAVAGLQGALDMAALGAGAALACYSILAEKGRIF